MAPAASEQDGRLFGLRYEPLAKRNLDRHIELELSPAEAASGVEKQVTQRWGKQERRLRVKIPAGVRTGMVIRLRGMGESEGGEAGDLYLHIRVGT